MSAEPGPAEGFAVEAEPDESPFAQVGDWVLLAPISDCAVRVYCLLRAHVNHARNDNEVWPSQEKLAAVLGLSKADKIGEAVKALESIGAVRKKWRTGRKGRYTVYVVRLHAPAGWTGLRSAAEDLHRPGVVEQLVRERVRRLPHRTDAARKAVQDATDEQMPSSADITPNPGGSPEQVTPDSGATPDRGEKAPPNQGVKPYEGEPDEGATTSSTAPPPRDDVERLCHRLRERMIGNGCKPPTITDSWRTSARLLLDKDGRDLDKALNLLDWATADEFWMANVQSMGKFRAQYDRLRLLAIRDHEQKKRTAAGPQRRSQTAVAVESTRNAFEQYRAELAAQQAAPRALTSASARVGVRS